MHDKDNADGHEEHAKEDVAPNAYVLDGCHEIGPSDGNAKERHGKEYGGVAHVFNGVCKDGRERYVVPKDNETKDRHDGAGAENSF